MELISIWQPIGGHLRLSVNIQIDSEAETISLDLKSDSFFVNDGFICKMRLWNVTRI